MYWDIEVASEPHLFCLSSGIVSHNSCMPESVSDRCSQAWEPIIMLTKNEKYFFDHQALVDTAEERYELQRTLFEETTSDDADESDGQVIGPRPRNVWRLRQEPSPEAHCAVFPQDLPRRCILLGSSSKGCCRICGAPWQRFIRDTGQRVVTEAMKDCGGDAEGHYYGQAVKDYKSVKAQDASDTKRRVLESMSKVVEQEWRPTCGCKKTEPMPCMVLDPFTGSGTTALVAKKLGRNYIGVELKQEYADMAAKRIKNHMGLFA
jgi:hypothetical protein